jgi:poly-gamma-glutamate capsule biosynthesis protein CapA/YwtB (metallophosphatase superfamily)
MKEQIVTGTLVVLTMIFFAAPSITHEAFLGADRSAQPPQLESEAHATSTLLFVGDIMMGRAVEDIIKEHGALYPFLGLEAFLTGPDLTIGNFEGIVSRTHVQTPVFTFRFSIRNEYLTAIKSAGFDILSLANNHAYDYGDDALNYTRSLCAGLRLFCGGSPVGVDSFSTLVKEVNGRKIGFLFLQAVSDTQTKEQMISKLEELERESDIQVVFIHWGTEYNLTHSKAQEELAHAFIDAGADAIIGSHPHVVEDVALYKGKPIFYSLGNFVFDQYFSHAVTEGLTVRMEIGDSNITYVLRGVTSNSSRAQPFRMKKDAQKTLFMRIMNGLSDDGEADIKSGTITLPLP